MKALLAIFMSGQDHQLRGMYHNWWTGLFTWRSEQMIPCWSPAFEKVTPAPAMSEIYLNRIDLHTGKRVVIESTLLPNNLFILETTGNRYRWRADTTKPIPQGSGVYDITFADFYMMEFITAPFRLCTAETIPVANFNTNSPGGQLVATFETNNGL